MHTIEDMMKLLTTQEPLCDELQACYSDDGRFPMVRHPLVYSVPHNDSQNALLNFQLQEKKREVSKMMDEQDYVGYVFIHEKPYRFNAFKEVMEHMQDDMYWEILSDVWTNSENIWQNIDEWKSLLSSDRKGKAAFMSKEERAIYNALPDKVTAYRGYQPALNMAGLSYSLSKDKAEWFANRYSKKGKVIKVTVPKKKVFAYLDGRNEKEIIIL